MREFKINNNYSRYFARHFVYLHPEYKDFFEFRGEDDIDLKKKYWEWSKTDEGKYFFAKFMQLSLSLITKGVNRYSSDAILHVIRFKYDAGEYETKNKNNNQLQLI